MSKGKMKLSEKEVDILQNITVEKVFEPPLELDPEQSLVSGFMSSIMLV